jgi:hypothetical protein
MDQFFRHLLKFSFLLSLVTSISFCYGQAKVSNVVDMVKLKNAPTYVVIADTLEEENKLIVSAIRKAWTLSDLQFIYRENVYDIGRKGCNFVSLELLRLEDKSLTYPGKGSGPDVKYITIIKEPAIMLWHSKPRANSNELIDDIHIELADNPFKFNPNKPDEIGSTEMYYNMSPGFIYNQIQYLQFLIRSQKTMKADDDINNATVLRLLKTDTLFIPKYIMKGAKVVSSSGTPPNIVVTYEPVKVKASAIFSDYAYTYKTISDSALDARILAGIKFYYITYYTEVYTTYVSITNSKTGEIVYCKAKRGLFPDEDGVYHMSKANVKRLQEAIDGVK